MTLAYVEITCCNCGVTFLVPPGWERQRLKDGKSFWCPNGHPQHFTASRDKDAEISRLKQRLAEADDTERALRDKVEAEQRRVNGYKRQLARTKKRVAGGVCPCCNRSFTELRRHMAEKHPDYLQSESAP